MQKVKNYRCPECNKVYQSLATWSNHVVSQHPELIPEGYTPARYFYYLQTGKTGNKCIVCKRPTEWNEATGKYERFCKDPACKEKYREMFKQRMINSYGKVTLLNDPEQQRKMLEAKKAHGEVTFPDGGKIGYNSTYEKDFLVMLSSFLNCNASDIMGPSPHTYYYDYHNPNDKENEGRKFYIPDYWIPSLNLEIEIKQNTSTHPKILAVDKVKEAQKDEMMRKIPGVRYIKIVDKDYSGFFDLLYQLKETYPDKKDIAIEGFAATVNSTPRDWSKTESDLLELVLRLGVWRYGFIMNGRPSDDFGEDDINFETYYRTLKPAEFGRYKCGICFDYAAYIHDVLARKHHILSQCYYIKFGDKDGWDNTPVHSFCVFPGNGVNYYLESCAKHVIGLYSFETLSDVVSFIKKCSPNIKSKDVHCYQYNPENYYGLTAKEFDQKVRRECDEVHITLNNNPKVTPLGENLICEANESFLYNKRDEDSEDLTLCVEFLNSIRTVLNERYDVNREVVIESAGYSKECTCPVFILLTKGHSPLSGIIMKATGDQFSHSSISFDISLNPMYSFGTKKLGPPREMGFVKTHPKDPAWDPSQPTPYWLYVTYVDRGSAEKMKERLNFFIENAEKMRYSFGGLPKVFFQLKSRKNQKWFCSAFVAEVLGAGKVLKKDSMLYMPRDLKDIDDVEFVMSGADISTYNPNEAKKALEKIKKQSPEEEIAEESILDIFRPVDATTKASLIQNFKDAIFGSEFNSLVGKAPPTTSKYVTTSKVIVDNKRGLISIQNINIKLLIRHIRETFGEKRLDYIFDRTYSAYDIHKFKAKRITRSQMKITSLNTPVFFALELTILFNELYKKYRYKYYASIAVQIYNASWLSELDKDKKRVPLNMSRLNNLMPDYELESWQKDFITLYPELRARLGLRGYYLSFDQGLGKTLTAAALAEVRGVDTVYIIAPNNVCSNWVIELNKYFGGKYKSMICGKDVGVNANDVKFFIVNNESIKNMIPYLRYKKDSTMLIVDECHNFRNLNGQRVDELVQFREKLSPEDVLLLSGTPIKAIPNEIVPALKLLDPLFTNEAAEIYNACFKFDSYMAMDIVKNRFGKIMYRKTKEDLRREQKLFLPEKYPADLPLSIPAPEKYFLKNIRAEVEAEFLKFYKEMSKDDDEKRARLIQIVDAYSTADPKLNDQYVGILLDVTSRNPDAPEGFGEPLHEIDKSFFDSFLANYVTNNPQIPNTVITEVTQLEREFIRLKNSAMGKAIGKIYPPRRSSMYNELFKYNRDLIEGMILNADKKVIIFTQFVPTANYIASELNNDEIKTVLITGAVGNRGAILEQFKTDADTKVLVATSQTLGVGVTLIEASNMFFFGPPWRATDYDQCCDRIYRYGQTVDVYIWNVTLDTPSPNLSDRMEKILQWSDTMFHSAIDVEDVAVTEACTIKPSKKGVYYKDRWNSMIELAGKTYRERVEVLVFRNDTVYIVETKDGYLLPGGSTEHNKSLEEQAIAEVKEECRFIISDLQYVDTHYVQFDAARKKKNFRTRPDFPVRYDGECNHIFTAQYKSGYAGIILSKDTDPEMLYGHWVKFKDAKHILRPEHAGLIPDDNNTITNLQPAEESLITPAVVEIPGRKDYRFEKTHVLMVSTNDPSNNLLKEVYDIKAIEDRMTKAGIKEMTIIDVDEFITYYCGGRGALKNERTIFEVATQLSNIFQKKKVARNRVDIFKRFPEMLAEFTRQEPKHGIILNIIPTAYGLLPYDCYRIDMGSMNRIRGAIKEGIYDYRRGNTFHHMMDPNLKNKGVLVQNPEKLELYHVSTNLDLTSLTPNPTRSPMFGEMVVIPRVSAAPTVDKCFGAIYKRYHNVYAVYKLLPTKTTRIFRPGEKAVPDVKQSGEVWVLDPVKVKKIDEVIITYIKNKVFTIKTSEEHGEAEIDTTGQVFKYGIECSAPMVKPPFIIVKLCPKDNPTEIASYAKIDCETEYVWISTKRKYKRISAELEKALKEYIHNNLT